MSAPTRSERRIKAQEQIDTAYGHGLIDRATWSKLFDNCSEPNRECFEVTWPKEIALALHL